LYTLPHVDLGFLERIGYKQKLADVDEAILANANFLDQIVANPEIFGHDISSLEDSSSQELDYSMESHTHATG
jgi:carnosine N-methyltransferase